MLRNIFPDEPAGDQDAACNADDPGTYFQEFLPSGIKVQSPQQRAAAHAAAAVKASAAEAAAAAAAASSGAASPTAAAADSSSSDDGILPDLPTFSELKSVADAWFGDDDDAEAHASTDAAAGKKAGEESEEEGLLDKLLPSFGGKESGLRHKAFRGRTKTKPKPLRLKLAEQVLSKELLSAVQLVESEILSSADPLPSATIKFFLKAGRSMGSGWARQNATRIFGFLTAYVAATCGLMHGVKAAAKWLAWRIPRVGKKVAGPAVSFTADVLLPTPFLGPSLAAYVLIMVLIKPPRSGDSNAAAEAQQQAAAAGGAAAGEGAAGDQRPQQQQQQQAQEASGAVERSRSRQLQLEFVVDEASSKQLRGRQQQLRGRRPLAKVGSIKGRVRNRLAERERAAAVGTVAAAGGGRAVAAAAAVVAEGQEEESVISADVLGGG